MGFKKIHNDDKFRNLWISGKRLDEMALIYDVGRTAISSAAKRYGLTPRHIRGPEVVPDKIKATPKPKKAHSKIVGDLIRSKGRYADLAPIAAREGWSSSRAMQEYHKAKAAA